MPEPSATPGGFVFCALTLQLGETCPDQVGVKPAGQEGHFLI